MTRHLVRDLIEPAPVTLTGDTPIRRAVAQMVADNALVAPVTGPDGRLAGILTQKDCFRPALQAAYYQEWAGTVADFMTSEVITIDADEDAIHAAEQFLTLPHRILPVLDGGRFVGLLDRAAVLALLSRIG